MVPCDATTTPISQTDQLRIKYYITDRSLLPFLLQFSSKKLVHHIKNTSFLCESFFRWKTLFTNTWIKLHHPNKTLNLILEHTRICYDMLRYHAQGLQSQKPVLKQATLWQRCTYCSLTINAKCNKTCQMKVAMHRHKHRLILYTHSYGNSMTALSLFRRFTKTEQMRYRTDVLSLILSVSSTLQEAHFSRSVRPELTEKTELYSISYYEV